MNDRRAPPPLPPRPTGADGLDGVDESTWMDVIQKMDEVYSQLVHDEIELEQKNSALEQSQQFIFSVLTAMSDVLLVCDAQGLIEETNAALCELAGRPESALRGTSFFELLADAPSIDRARAVLSRAAPARSAESVELHFRAPVADDGSPGAPVPVDVSCTPRIGPQGRRLGSVLVGRPTAEIQRAYRELHAAHESLKLAQKQLLHSEKMASLGRLVAGVAHELNNPISFVLGNVHALGRYSQRLATYLDAVHAGQPPGAFAAERAALRIDHVLADLPSLIEGTLEGAQRTADIVGGLKRFSAMDAEARAPVDLNEVVERAMHWVGKGTGPGVAMHWTPGPPCRVIGNAGQLQQVLMNLLQNACDAASGPGAAAPALWVACEHDASKVRLHVRDNGPGIPPDDLLRIFDPFFTTKPVGKGTGLGLSISYGLAEQHGGRLSARNPDGGGAEFTLELPLAPPA